MSDKRRPGTMTDEDRALAAIERRRAQTEPTEEVVDAFDSASDKFTPVAAVLERAADLTDRERYLLRYIWAHTANMEMRARARSDSQDTSLLARRIDDVETKVVDIQGVTGTNGKLGTLKGRVDVFLARAWWLVTVLVGALGAAAVKLVIVGRAYGELETQVQANNARIHLLERVVFLKSPPAASPEKAAEP